MRTPVADVIHSSRLARSMVALAILLPWSWPLLSQPIVTFYKEWICVIALGLGGLCLAATEDISAWLYRHPLFPGSIAMLAVLVVQGCIMEAVWHKAALMAFYVAFFIVSIGIGRTLHCASGSKAFPWLAWCLLAAAATSAVMAALQLSAVSAYLPFILPRNGDRLAGNVGQANQLADLLWLGCVAAAYLFAQGKLRYLAAASAIVAMESLSVLTGSRMIWIFMVVLLLISAGARFRGSSRDSRRFSGALVAVVLVYPVVATAISMSGVSARLGVVSAESRAGTPLAAESTEQRLWFWRAGLDAIKEAPLLGVGVGRFAGHAMHYAMSIDSNPPHVADSQAHNIFLQVAAEEGLPLCLIVAVCIAGWLVSSWRKGAQSIDDIAALSMISLILVHANLEHPLVYTYFVCVLGLLAGHVGAVAATSNGNGSFAPTNVLRIASFVILAAAVVGYTQYATVERAMKVAIAEMQDGVPLQPTLELNLKLSKVALWSPYVEYAELISLVTSVPSDGTAKSITRRCSPALEVGPAPHLLARCATAFQVAGEPGKATYLANSLCRLYPESADVLVESMTFVAGFSPRAADLRSLCVGRRQATQ